MSAKTPYTITRSCRKTVAIHILESAAIEVRAPFGMPIADIDRFVESKDKWIRSHLEKASARFAARSTFSLGYGSTITLFGKDYPITADHGSGYGRSFGSGFGARFDGRSVIVPAGLDDAGVKRAVIRLYTDIAKDTLGERAAHFAGLMGVVPACIKINGAKARWGSCSGCNSINFSWRLVMADEDVVDYVVVHELAHIRELNHSPRFWAVVEGILPNYADSRRTLRLLQEKLAAEDWDD